MWSSTFEVVRFSHNIYCDGEYYPCNLGVCGWCYMIVRLLRERERVEVGEWDGAILFMILV